MSFTSPFFLPFLVLVAALVALGRRFGRAPLFVVLTASLLFYATWSPVYCLALLFTASLDFSIGLALEKCQVQATRRLLLAASLGCNLGLLACLKYFNFFADTLCDLTRAAGGGVEAPLRIVFAVGISFYTFQSASYVIDVYRGDQAATRSWPTYLAFVSFFPTLLAGPITRADTLLPQLERLGEPLDADRASSGLFLIATGLVKKGLADFVAVNLVSRVFELPGMYSSLEVAAGIYAYAVQIYCDFSGYSDIAIGAAALLGVGLKDNFNCPYRAGDLAEFWRRWHISLSTWLRDYLYFALPGKRVGTPWPYVNLVVTFAIGGLWHGAAWTTMLWGALHGVGLAVVRLATGGRPPQRSRWQQVAWTVGTFHFVAFSWILFRCSTLGQVGALLAQLGRGSLSFANLPVAVVGIVALVVASQWAPRDWLDRARLGFVTMPALAQGVALLALGAGLRLLGSAAPSPFIYFAY